MTSPRWADPADLHITLVFIGATAPETIAALHGRVAALAPSLNPFDYELRGPLLFPDARRPRVLALVPEEAGAFAAWQAPLADACTALGCRIESRPYRPHLSLARLRQAPAGAIDAAPALHGSAREIVLFESAQGHYRPLFRVASRERAA